MGRVICEMEIGFTRCSLDELCNYSGTTLRNDFALQSRWELDMEISK